MKISIIGPGIMPIPPTGWGAVECLIWDYATELRKRGHEVQIVNTANQSEIVEQVNNFNPDFVHLQYDDYTKTLEHIKCRYKAATSHYGYIEQFNSHKEYYPVLYNFLMGDFYIFCLSENIKNTYATLGVSRKRLFVTPNGANASLFNYSDNPIYPERSIYLAKIDYRKRQYVYQDIDNLYFAGNCVDSRFNTNSERYLGEWSKETLYQNLTNYSNLVLLSDGEADPLVTKEALIAGLGLVISECAIANLDLSLPYITVIPDKKLDDIDYVLNAIKNNRQIANESRKEIREYGLKKHSWSNIVDNYLNLLNTIMA